MDEIKYQHFWGISRRDDSRLLQAFLGQRHTSKDRESIQHSLPRLRKRHEGNLIRHG